MRWNWPQSSQKVPSWISSGTNRRDRRLRTRSPAPGKEAARHALTEGFYHPVLLAIPGVGVLRLDCLSPGLGFEAIKGGISEGDVQGCWRACSSARAGFAS